MGPVHPGNDRRNAPTKAHESTNRPADDTKQMMIKPLGDVTP